MSQKISPLVKGLVPLTLVVLLAMAAVPPSVGALTLPNTVTPRLAGAIEGLAPDAEIRVIAMTEGPAAPVADLARERGIEVGWVYDIIDGFSAKLTLAQLSDLARLPGILELWDDRPTTTLLANSAPNSIRASTAWNAGYNGSGITVAVIDTGVDVGDPAFPSGTIVACVSTVYAVVSPECTDSDGHGTHVAATVASRVYPYRGVAPNASLAIVRVLHAAGAGLSSDIIRGINWVGNNHNVVTPNIKVATMSIGYVSPGCGNGQEPEAKAADALVAKGVSFTIAAGNSGHTSCTVDGASAAFNVVTVGAADDRNTATRTDELLAGFSSGGPTTDGRLKPEIVAPGVGITASYLGPTYSTLSGTSMATPHVAGAIALYLNKNGATAPATVKSDITSTAYAPTAATGLPNNDWGHGLLDVCELLNLAGC